MDQKMQAAYEAAVTQVVSMLAEDQAAAAFASDVAQRGPEVAIVDLVTAAAEGVAQAAGGVGVQLPPELVAEVKVTAAKVVIMMLQESGMIEDPDAVMEGVMSQLGGVQ